MLFNTGFTSPYPPQTLLLSKNSLHYAPILEAHGPRPVMLSRTSPDKVALACTATLFCILLSSHLLHSTASWWFPWPPLLVNQESPAFTLELLISILALTPLSISFLRFFPLWPHLRASIPGSLVMC